LSSGARRKRLGRERLQRVIDLCRSVEERGLDPFVVEVDDIIAVVREYFPDWDRPEELCLDAEAVHGLSSVIKLQSDWVRQRSTSLYRDPFLLEERIRELTGEGLAHLLLRVWNPVVEMEQITPRSLAEAVGYWGGLLPLSERWRRTGFLERGAGTATREELVRERVLAEEAFSERLEAFWGELRQRAGGGGRIRYWDFVGAETYPETAARAYLTSFLVTYGYATLELHRLEEELFIVPYERREPLLGKEDVVSVPVSVDVEEWRRWREKAQG